MGGPPAIIPDVPAIVPLVSVVIVALLVAATAAATATAATATATAAAATAHVLLVRRLLRLHGPVPSMTPASILLLSADAKAQLLNT